jgi:hypothetical protein
MMSALEADYPITAITYFFQDPCPVGRVLAQASANPRQDRELAEVARELAELHHVNPRIPLCLMEARFGMLSYGTSPMGQTLRPRSVVGWLSELLLKLDAAIEWCYQTSLQSPVESGFRSVLRHEAIGPSHVYDVWERFFAWDTLGYPLEYPALLVRLDGNYWFRQARETEDGIEFYVRGEWTPWRQTLPLNIQGSWDPLRRTLELQSV